jgi:hypothetical protein
MSEKKTISIRDNNRHKYCSCRRDYLKAKRRTQNEVMWMNKEDKEWIFGAPLKREIATISLS